MDFNPINFRKLGPDSRPTSKIRMIDGSPLILVKANGEAQYAVGRMDKDALIDQFNGETDMLLWAWGGQYKTDVFLLSQEDLINYYK